MAYKEEHHRDLIKRIYGVFVCIFIFKPKQISKGIEFDTVERWVMNLLMKYFNPIEFDGVKIRCYIFIV